MLFLIIQQSVREKSAAGVWFNEGNGCRVMLSCLGGRNGLRLGCDFQQQVGGRLVDLVANSAGGDGRTTHFVDYQMTHPM